MKTLKTKHIQYVSLIAIVFLFLMALCKDFLFDYSSNFKDIIFSETNIDQTINSYNCHVFNLKEDLADNVKGFSQKDIAFINNLKSEPDGRYSSFGVYCVKKEGYVYGFSNFELIWEKLKITRQTISYVPYLICILLAIVILPRMMAKKETEISFEVFLLILIEILFTFTFMINNLGFNVYFDNCYSSFLFYFYVGYLLLLFAAITHARLFIIPFFIIWFGLILFAGLMIARSRSLSLSFNMIQLIIIALVTGRHYFLINKQKK